MATSAGSGVLPLWLQENSSSFIHEEQGLWRSKQENRKQIYLGGTRLQAGECPGHQERQAWVKDGSVKAPFLPAFLPWQEGGSHRANHTLHVLCGDPVQQGSNSARIPLRFGLERLLFT